MLIYFRSDLSDFFSKKSISAILILKSICKIYEILVNTQKKKNSKATFYTIWKSSGQKKDKKVIIWVSFVKILPNIYLALSKKDYLFSLTLY